MTDAAQIEAYLLENRHWIPASEICARFGIHERALRGLRDRPGLCSEEFAISGDKGFKHLKYATKEEVDHCCNRLRKHGISELVKARNIRHRHKSLTITRAPVIFEKATGQVLLLA